MKRMLKLFLLLSTLIFSITLFAQDDEVPSPDTETPEETETVYTLPLSSVPHEYANCPWLYLMEVLPGTTTSDDQVAIASYLASISWMGTMVGDLNSVAALAGNPYAFNPYMLPPLLVDDPSFVLGPTLPEIGEGEEGGLSLDSLTEGGNLVLTKVGPRYYLQLVDPATNTTPVTFFVGENSDGSYTGGIEVYDQFTALNDVRFMDGGVMIRNASLVTLTQTGGDGGTTGRRVRVLAGPRTTGVSSDAQQRVMVAPVMGVLARMFGTVEMNVLAGPDFMLIDDFGRSVGNASGTFHIGAQGTF